MIDCSECKFDSKCCSMYRIVLERDEYKNYKYKRFVRFFDKNEFLGYVCILTYQENGYCIYFDNITKLCKIYENRPKACRNWEGCLKWL